MADASADTNMTPASGGGSGGGGDAEQIFKHGELAYYCSAKEMKAKKVKVERYSTSQPGKIYIQGGGVVDSGMLFTTKEKAEAEFCRQLATRPSKKARVDDKSNEVLGRDSIDPAAVAAAASVVDLPLDSEAKEAQAVDFARRAATWLEQLASGSSTANGSLPIALAEKFPLDPSTRAKMLAAVPWDSNRGYTTMLRYPKFPKCKGVLHIACFDYSEKGLHGKGLYAGVDAISWLRSGNASTWFSDRRIDVVPVLAPGSPGNTASASGDTGGGEPLSMFGYGSDGTMINATIVFALASIVFCSIDEGVALPELWLAAAGAINVQYTKFTSGMERLVSNMMSSNLASKVNRSMDDPLLLARELGRQGMTGVTEIRNVMKMYRARIMGAANLTLKRSTEEVTVRLMDRGKFCEDAISVLARITQATGWQAGPISQESLAAPKLVINAQLVESMNPTWAAFCVQTAASQTLILEFIEKRMIEELAERCTLSRYNKDSMENLAVCVGLWQQILTKIVPSLSLPDEKVTGLSSLVFEDESLQQSLLMLASGSGGEAPHVANVTEFAPFILQHIVVLRNVQADHRRELRSAADSHPQVAITKQQMDQLTTGIYGAEVTLDANRYRVAHSRAAARATDDEDKRASAMRLHISNVKQAQEYLARVDVVLNSPASGGASGGGTLPLAAGRNSLLASGSSTRNRDSPMFTCFPVAVGEATRNRKALLTAMGSGGSSDTTGKLVALNVVQLQTQGMLKQKTLTAIKANVLNGNLPGPILIMYPQISSGSYKSERVAFVSAKGSQSQESLQTESDASASGDESDENDDNDGNDDLPEVMTKGVKTSSHWDGKVSLANDHFQIEQLLGHHDCERYFPQQITFVHTPGGHGNPKERKRIEKGLLLVPIESTTSASGDATEIVNAEMHEKSTLFRDGVFTNVEETNEYIKVSRESSMKCFTSQSGHWQTHNLKCSSRGHISSKTGRCQLGWKTYLCLIKDVLKGMPPSSTLLINDFMVGVGELGVAAMHARASPEAKDLGVRVCYFGYESRKMFAQIAKANINTTIGELFLANQLAISGLTPIQAPTPASGGSSSGAPSRELIMEELARDNKDPLKQLSVHANGSLVIPSVENWEKNPIVPMSEELGDILRKLREEFPPTEVEDQPPNPPAPAPPAPPGPPGPDLMPNSDDVMATGSQFTSRAELLQTSGCKILKEVCVSGESFKLILVKVTVADSGVDHFRVLLEAAAQDISLEAGHFVGRCGPGLFIVVNEGEAASGAEFPEGRRGINAWTFNRGTQYKSDIAYRANGMWVLENAVGAPAASGASANVPKMMTLEGIAAELGGQSPFKTLWAHTVTFGKRGVKVVPTNPSTRVLWTPKLAASGADADVEAFDANCMGAFLPSWEVKGETGLECQGVLRPAFALALDGTCLEPAGKATPQTANAVCLFLKRALKLSRDHLITL